MVQKRDKKSVCKSNKKNTSFKEWKNAAESFVKAIKSVVDKAKKDSNKARAYEISEIESMRNQEELLKLEEEAVELEVNETHASLLKLTALKEKCLSLTDQMQNNEFENVQQFMQELFLVGINVTGAFELSQKLSSLETIETKMEEEEISQKEELTNSQILSYEELQCFVKGIGNQKVEDSKLAIFQDNNELFANVYEMISKIWVENLGKYTADDLKQIFLDLEKINVQLDCTYKVEAYIKILEAIYSMASILMPDIPICDFFKGLVTELLEKVKAWDRKELKDSEITELKKLIENVKIAQNNAEIKNYEFLEFMHKLDLFTWEQEATVLVKNNKAKQEIVKNLLKNTPKELKNSHIFKQLLEKIKCDIKDINESDLNSQIEEYYKNNSFVTDKTQILELVKTYKTSSHLLSDELLIKLDLLEQVTFILTENKLNNIEQIVEKMLEDNFYWNCEAFLTIEGIFRNIQEWKNLKEIADQFKDHVEKTIFDEKLVLDKIKSFGKINLEKAEIMVKDFENSETSIVKEYKEYADYLSAELMEQQAVTCNFNKMLNENKKNFVKIFDSNKKAELTQLKTKVIPQYHTLLVEYEQSFIESNDTISKIKEIDCYIRANCLILGIDFPELSKDYSTCCDLSESLAQYAKESPLEQKISDMTKNTKESIKSLNNLENTKKMSVEEAKNFIKTMKDQAEGVDFGAENLKFEKTITKIEETLNIIETKEVITFKEITEHYKFLKRAPVDISDFLKNMENTMKNTSEFSKKIVEMTPEDFCLKFEELQQEQKTLKVLTKEADRMFKDYERDNETQKEIKDSFKNYLKIDLNKIRELRARYSAARYFKSLNSELGLVDFNIRVLIKVYNESKNQIDDLVAEKIEENDDKIIEEASRPANITNVQPIIDYGKLKELYNGIKLQKKSKLEVPIINQKNAMFITKLYKKCKESLKKNIFTKSLKELQEGDFTKSFRDMVDLTGQIYDFQCRLEERSNVKVKKRKAIAPSGQKIAHKRRFNYDISNSNSKQEIVKPSFTNKITKDLRIFYIKSFKLIIDSTSYYKLDSKESIKLAHNLEKTLCKLFTNILAYEKFGDKMSKILKGIRKYEFLCKRLQNKGFDIACFNEMNGLSSEDFKKFNEFFQTKHDSKNDKKSKGMLGKVISAKDPRRLAKIKREKALKKEETTDFCKFETKIQPEKLRKEKEPKSNKKPKKMLPKYASPPKTTVNKDICMKPSNLVKSYYSTLKIFSGDMSYSVDSSTFPMKKIEFLAVNRKSRAECFSAIPDKGMNLNTKIPFAYFHKYMDYVTSDAKKYEYCVMPGWIPSNNSTIKLRNVLVDTKTVASDEYSNSCKVFVYPVSALPMKMLEKFDLFADETNIDLLYFVIRKKSVKCFQSRVLPVEIQSYHRPL